MAAVIANVSFGGFNQLNQPHCCQLRSLSETKNILINTDNK